MLIVPIVPSIVPLIVRVTLRLTLLPLVPGGSVTVSRVEPIGDTRVKSPTLGDTSVWAIRK